MWQEPSESDARPKSLGSCCTFWTFGLQGLTIGLMRKARQQIPGVVANPMNSQGVFPETVAHEETTKGDSGDAWQV